MDSGPMSNRVISCILIQFSSCLKEEDKSSPCYNIMTRAEVMFSSFHWRDMAHV